MKHIIKFISSFVLIAVGLSIFSSIVNLALNIMFVYGNFAALAVFIVLLSAFISIIYVVETWAK